jgi:hypothetical protein
MQHILSVRSSFRDGMGSLQCRISIYADECMGHRTVACVGRGPRRRTLIARSSPQRSAPEIARGTPT